MKSNPQPQESSQTKSAEVQPVAGGQIEADRGSDYLITVQVEPDYEDRINADSLHRLAIGVLQAEGAEGPLELGVVVTTDKEVHALNVEYLGHDYDTDVISFGMQEEALGEGTLRFVTPPDRPSYLGDIAISYERAAEQAPEFGQGVKSEVATLLIHGLLHLLGYDDMDEDSRQRMHARQQELLEALFDPEL